MGSRNETNDTWGVCHYLREAAVLSNKRSTSGGLLNHTQHIAAGFGGASDRETLAYSVEVAREDIETGLKFLQDASTEQEFKPWEIEDMESSLKNGLANLSTETKVVDLLHRAAFNDTLGNSIYVPTNYIGKLSAETLSSFAAKNLSADRTTVVGTGIEHSLLVRYAKNLCLVANSDTASPSKYRAGDVREHSIGNLATVAVGTQGAALTNQKEALAFAVLQLAAGWSTTAEPGVGLLSAVASKSLKAPYTLNVLNASYSDNGLFGLILSGSADEVGPVKSDFVPPEIQR